MASISACLIMKNEAANLARCLASLKPWMPEIVAVDTGSSDNSIELARSFGASVTEFAWNGSFADARNFALGLCSSEWVLSVDCDEILDQETAPNLRKLVERKAPFLMSYSILIRNLQDREGAQLTYESYGHRLFPRHPKLRWHRDVHEQLLHEDGPGHLHQKATKEVALIHYGYLTAEWEGKGKRERNIVMLQAAIERENDPYDWYNLGQEHYGARGWDEAIPCFLTSIEGAKQLTTGLPIYTAYAWALAVGSCVESGQFKRGVEIGQEGIRHHDYADLWCNLGTSWLGAQQPDQAIACFRRAIRAQEYVGYAGDAGAYSWRALQYMGDAYAAQSEFVRAIECYRQSRQAEPGRPAPYCHEAACLAAIGEVEMAKRVLRDVLDKWPENEEAKRGLVELEEAEVAAMFREV